MAPFEAKVPGNFLIWGGDLEAGAFKGYLGPFSTGPLTPQLQEVRALRATGGDGRR